MSSAVIFGSEVRSRYLPSRFSPAFALAASIRSRPPGVTRRYRCRPGLNRYLRVTPGGLLRIDASRAKAEENLDGKYLLRTSDPAMTSEDIALGYKQLLQVETSKPQCCHNRGWSALSSVPSRSVFMLAA